MKDWLKSRCLVQLILPHRYGDEVFVSMIYGVFKRTKARLSGTPAMNK